MNDDEIKRRRLRWKCRRGMLELDLLLLKFFDSEYDKLDLQEKLLFEQLIEEEDPTLYAWLIHAETPKHPEINALINKISTINMNK